MREEQIRQFQIGSAEISIITTGAVQVNFAQGMNIPPDVIAARPELQGMVPLPVQSLCVRLPETTLLVDPGVYDPDSKWSIPDYQPPPPLLAQLAQIGVAVAEIEHVVITHAHFDHYNGTTIARDGNDVPTFPNARYYLGRKDWQQPHLQAARHKPDTLERRTLGVLYAAGVLELVDGQRDLGHGIHLLPAAGESPGHQIVRIQSDGETLYYLGDLYHHAVEFEQPTWMVNWADAARCVRSRKALVKGALAKNAYLVATHIVGIGRLDSTGTIWNKIT